MELTIGPRLYSTWSLRGWLAMKRTGSDFAVRSVEYASAEQKAALRDHSPTGLVPLLQVGEDTIWDTLAIAEWAAETYPQAQLWPADPAVRAYARSVTAEMHSGFAALRALCGMGPSHPIAGDVRSDLPSDPALDRDLSRLVSIWKQMRGRYGADGPWLFGAWSIADAFFTPVAARVRHYRIDLSQHGDTDGIAAAYMQTLLSQPDFLEWEAEALAS